MVRSFEGQEKYCGVYRGKSMYGAATSNTVIGTMGRHFVGSDGTPLRTRVRRRHWVTARRQGCNILCSHDPVVRSADGSPVAERAVCFALVWPAVSGAVYQLGPRPPLGPMHFPAPRPCRPRATTPRVGHGRNHQPSDQVASKRSVSSGRERWRTRRATLFRLYMFWLELCCGLEGCVPLGLTGLG